MFRSIWEYTETLGINYTPFGDFIQDLIKGDYSRVNFYLQGYSTQNRLLTAGLESFLSQTEISRITSNYRQFSTNIEIKIIKLIPVLLARAFGPSGLKIGFNRIIFHFDIRGKLSIIRCDKYILYTLQAINRIQHASNAHMMF